MYLEVKPHELQYSMATENALSLCMIFVFFEKGLVF